MSLFTFTFFRLHDALARAEKAEADAAASRRLHLQVLKERAEALQRIDRLEKEVNGYRRHLRECEQIAGKALGYPWYKDDQQTFPGANEADGVCIGEHVGDTIVAELAAAYKALQEALRVRNA